MLLVVAMAAHRLFIIQLLKITYTCNIIMKNRCNARPSRATANPVGGKACSSTKGGLLRYIPNIYSIHKAVSSLKFAYFQGRLPPPRRLVPSLGLGTTWVRQLLSGSCHYPTAATKCNAWPSRATANPVGGKSMLIHPSSTKGGLLRYIPNTYSIHKAVSSLKFAYFQGRLPRHTGSRQTGQCMCRWEK